MKQENEGIMGGFVNKDGVDDAEMAMKIESMISHKKAKDKKQLLNNPPKKETLLKDSKDNQAISNTFIKKGLFGIPKEFKDEFEKGTMNKDTWKNMNNFVKEPGINLQFNTTQKLN